MAATPLAKLIGNALDVVDAHARTADLRDQLDAGKWYEPVMSSPSIAVTVSCLNPNRSLPRPWVRAER